MIGIRTLCVAIASFAVSSCGLCADIPIVFDIIDTVRTETISYSTGNTSSQVIRHHGTMDAVLTFDPSTQRPTAIRFTGGILYESPSTFKNTANIYFTGQGTKKVIFEQSATGLQMKTNTIGLAHSVTPDGWIQNTERLQTFPIAGKLTASLTIDGRKQTQSIDVATNPPDNTTPSMGTSIRLQVHETENHGSESDYLITFYTSLSASHSERLPHTDTTRSSTTSGTTLAEARFSAPSKYGQWLLDNGYNLEDQDSSNPRGIPLAVLFALGLTANAPEGIPWSFANEHGTLVLSLRLPNDGLQAAIKVEACENPKTDNWLPLTENDFLDGNSSLALGSTGTRRIRFSGTSRFYRLVPQ